MHVLYWNKKISYALLYGMLATAVELETRKIAGLGMEKLRDPSVKCSECTI